MAIELRSQPTPVNTLGSTSTAIATYLIGPIEGSKIKGCKPSMCFDDGSGDLEVAAIYSTSDDGITWGAGTALTSYGSTAGWTYASDVDLSSAAKAYFKFGFAARNKTATAIECARCVLIVELTFT